MTEDDDAPWRENVQPYVDKFERYARELLHDALRRYENGEISRADLDEIVDYLGFEKIDKEDR